MFQSRVVVVGARMIWRAEEEAKIFLPPKFYSSSLYKLRNVFRYFTIHTKKNLQSSDIRKKKRNQRRNSPIG